MKNSPVTKIWWLYIPVVAFAVQILIDLTLPYDILVPLHGENGPIELLQFIVISLAFLLASLMVIQFRGKISKWLLAWIGLAAICCFYVAGEEVSWGQHFMDWTTPEFWSDFNDQGETNFHNTSSWLDQKPRLILEIGVLVGGIIIPLLRRYKPSLLPQKFKAIYPDSHVFVIALIALIVKATDKITHGLEMPFFERASEVIELYLFYFVLLYLIGLRQRFKSDEKTETISTET